MQARACRTRFVPSVVAETFGVCCTDAVQIGESLFFFLPCCLYSLY